MPTNDENDALNNLLLQDLEFKTQAARQARAIVTKAFEDCAAGNGNGPTQAQVEEADRVEAIAAEANAKVNARRAAMKR